MTFDEIKNELSVYNPLVPGDSQFLIQMCLELCEQIEAMQEQIDYQGEDIERLEGLAAKAANTASCLANGIIPD